MISVKQKLTSKIIIPELNTQFSDFIRVQIRVICGQKLGIWIKSMKNHVDTPVAIFATQSYQTCTGYVSW